MNKVGILTFFEADNYGALLQCYALSHFCEENNCEAKVIDYHSRQMFTWKHRLKKKLIKTAQNKKFDSNRRNFFKVGSLTEDYDIVIVGSDQVWNPSIIKGDKFWIEPNLHYKRLISYAASLGKGNLTVDEEAFLHDCNFSKYDWISVREKTGQELMSKIGVQSEVVCDPTLLFYNQPEVYNSIVENSKLKQEKYIFVYSLEKSEKIDELSKQLSEKFGYKIISSHPANDRTQQCNEFVMDSDICDFLYLIKNAEIVVTNSFHGLAFSLVFRKEVFCVCHTTLGSRQTDLINESGLNYDCPCVGVYRISSYEKDEHMRSYIEKSKQLLNNNLY